MHKNIKLIISLTVGILLGVSLNLLIKKYSKLYIESQVSFEINPMEIFSILINVSLAIYITRNLSKLNDLEKKEKDLIIEYILNYKSEFTQRVDKLIEGEIFDSPITNSNFKILRTQLSAILSLGVEHKFIEESDDIVVQINKKVTDIWELFTDAPRKASSRTSAAVKLDIDRLKLEKVTKIETSAIGLEKLLFQLTMRINKK